MICLSFFFFSDTTKVDFKRQGLFRPPSQVIGNVYKNGHHIGNKNAAPPKTQGYFLPRDIPRTSPLTASTASGSHCSR